jgi:hypothetical protein
MDCCREAFGSAIYSWAKVTQLTLSALRSNAARLMAMRRDVPPEADVSDVPVPASADASEAHETDPPEIPEMGPDGYVAWGEVETLRLWAEMVGQHELFHDLTKGCTKRDGQLLVTLSQYVNCRNAIAWAAKGWEHGLTEASTPQGL